MSVEKRCTNSTPTVSATSSCCTPTAGGSTINSSSFLTPPSSSSRGRDKKSITDQQSLYQQHIISTSYHGHSTKQDFVPFGHSEDYLELESGSRGSQIFGSTLGVNTRVSKANSINMMNISCDDAEVMFVDQDDIIHLTHQVKNFSDALTKLKTVFTEGTICGDDVKVAAHEQLGEVLCTLRLVLQQYLALQSEDLFSAAGSLISKIKNYNYEDTISTGSTQSFCDSIDQLALAFSSSVSEYLMGDMDVICPVEIGKTKSYEVIPSVAGSSPHTPLDENKEIGVMGPEEVNVILKHLDSGVDKALQRAKVWSKYLKDIIYYIDKKAQLESEFSKNLIRLAQAAKPTLMEDAFLPLQSVYCTLLSQDTEYATNCQATQTLLQTQKFVRPLSSRRAEHDKIRKMVKETWSRELKKMHESISNLRKARSLYYNRKQEYEKAYELAMKTESEMLSQSGSSGSGTISSKVDKRKKMVEETMNRASEAEMMYKECILEANNRQQDLDKIKGDLLSKVYEQIFLCDSTIKSVTVEYFNLLHTVTAPLPLRFMTLCETSKQYEPASQYAEFVRRLPNTSNPQTAEPFAFEPYVPVKLSDDRKPSVHSSASYSSEILSQEGSPLCYDIHSQGSQNVAMKEWQCTEIGSDSDSSQSPESSPPTSPRGPITLEATTTNSMEDLLQGYSEESECSQHTKSSKTTDSSGGNVKQHYHHHHHHHHHLHGECSRTFGVKLEDHVKLYNTDVPLIVKKCLGEIEKKGITIKGIYRVSGVKSKVESLCKQFEADPEGVDLTEQHPNVITSVLKMYLRQLPEPLLTFDAYSSFIQVAKRDMVGNLSKEQTVQKLDELIQKLPTANRKTTALIIWHLRQVSEEANENQMNASNLGIVFGPTLLRPLEGTASLSSLVDTPHQTRAVELLITYADQLFGEKMETVLTSTPDSSSGKEKLERVPSSKPSRRDQSSESAAPEDSSTPEQVFHLQLPPKKVSKKQSSKDSASPHRATSQKKAYN